MLFFYFEQETRYEMRISDWSSDVCSSGLSTRRAPPGAARAVDAARKAGRRGSPRAGPSDRPSSPPRRFRQQPRHESRHGAGRRAVFRLGEERRALRRFEVELDGARAGIARLLHEARGGVDVSRGADGEEQAAAAERVLDALHLERHLAEPHDLRAHAAGGVAAGAGGADRRSEEHTSELQSLMRISYAVFCLN